MKKKLDEISQTNCWKPALGNLSYSKENSYGEQSFNFLKSLRKSFFLYLVFFKETLNLDIDFQNQKKVTLEKHTEIEILGNILFTISKFNKRKIWWIV